MTSSKYITLAYHLQNQIHSTISLSFSALEDIIGFPLPKSARKHRSWWANDSTHTHAENGWIRIGWKVTHIDMNKEVVQFTKVSSPITLLEAFPTRPSKPLSRASIIEARFFQEVARKALSYHFDVELRPGQFSHIPKLFDFVSPDKQIVGDAKYYSMVRGLRIPPAKFSTIAEHVWLLEKTGVQRKFLVFGNDRRVPEGWLERYGDLVNSVEFYFLDEEGNLTQMK